MRMRKKPNLVPRMERCARFLIQAPEEQRGHWRELKPDAEQIWLELGCGKGRFTAETAAQNPNVLYLAVERVPDAMIVAMERCAQRGLTNVFFVDGDAARLREYFAPDEVDRLFINFCDPWPSNRHARRRLTHQNFWSCTAGCSVLVDRSTLRRITGTCLNIPCSSSPRRAMRSLRSPGISTPMGSGA